jgi:hypothetical protein
MSRDPGRFLVIPGDKLMRLPSYTTQVSYPQLSSEVQLDDNKNLNLKFRSFSGS